MSRPKVLVPQAADDAEDGEEDGDDDEEPVADLGRLFVLVGTSVENPHMQAVQRNIVWIFHPGQLVTRITIMEWWMVEGEIQLKIPLCGRSLLAFHPLQALLLYSLFRTEL